MLTDIALDLNCLDIRNRFRNESQTDLDLQGISGDLAGIHGSPAVLEPLLDLQQQSDMFAGVDTGFRALA